MRSIILAAGRGSRLGGLTDTRPKCLITLAGKTLLAWQLNALRQAGISEISIVRGYQREQLDFNDIYTFDNPRWNETNMVESLVYADEWLSMDTCIVSYADIVYSPEHVGKLIRTIDDIVITYDTDWNELWKERFENPLDDAETFRVNDNGLLTEIGSRPTSENEIQGQYMGLVKIGPNGWRNIKKLLSTLPTSQRAKLDMTGLIALLLKHGIKVSTVPIRGQWLEIDNQNDLSLYERWCADNLQRIEWLKTIG